MRMAHRQGAGGDAMNAKRTNHQNDGEVGKNGSQPVTRAEFETVRKLIEERGETLDELRRDIQLTCRDLTEDVRRELQTQLTRIAQLQQEIDALKRRT